MISFNKLISKEKSLIFFILILLVGSFCFAGVGYSQDDPRIAPGVQVSPIRFDWDMNAGDERVGYVNLKNYSNEPYDVDVEIEDFYVTDDTSEARFFIPNENHPLYAYDVINWIEAPQKIRLEPGEGRDISFRIKVPRETPTGGYYGALFFKTAVNQSNSGGEEENSRIMVHQRVGVLLVMAIKGNDPVKKSGELQKFEALKKIFWSDLAKLEAEVKNDGNIHYKASGSLDIYKFGRKIDSVSVDSRMLYPGKYRRYDIDWKFSAWAYGFYKAKINLVSEDMQIKVAGETSFWIIPWKTTLAILILILIIWMIYKIFDSRFDFEIKKKEKNIEEPEQGNNE